MEYRYKGRKHNFKKMNADTKGLSYGYSSLMHYGLYVFSKNCKKTISLHSMTMKRVRQRNGPSKLDWKWLDEAYLLNPWPWVRKLIQSR